MGIAHIEESANYEKGIYAAAGILSCGGFGASKSFVS
jgi:hypothetical protein